MVTKKGLVVKKWSFPAQSGDEKGSRRQKVGFPPQNDDEKGSRRQKRAIFAPKW